MIGYPPTGVGTNSGYVARPPVTGFGRGGAYGGGTTGGMVAPRPGEPGEYGTTGGWPRSPIPGRPSIRPVGSGPFPNPQYPGTGRYDPNRGVPPGGQSIVAPGPGQPGEYGTRGGIPGRPNIPGQYGGMGLPRQSVTAPAGGAYGNPARGGYIPNSTGPGDRRYYDQSRNDLMSRYDTGAGGLQGQYDDRVKSLSDMLKGYGNQELADARQRGQNLDSQIQGSMTGRGLSGTTLAGAGSAMAAANMQGDLSRINERLQGQKVGLAERTTGDALGFGERAFQGGIGLGQQNIRDSRGDMENDRNFSEGQFQGDRAFGRGTYEDDRNFGQGVFEDARNFGNQNYNMDRAFDYNRGQDQQANAFRDRTFNYQQYLDQLNRGDRIGQNRLDFMERRNDGPDIQQLLELLMQQGQMA